MTRQPDMQTVALLARIESRLEELVPRVLAGQDGLGSAMRDGVLSPGKRLRPLIAGIVAEDLGGSREAAVEAGCAVEMVHAASLILDDLPCMDDAALRRGRPTIHKGHGEDVAVLAAIALLSESFAILSRLDGLDGERRSAAVGVLTAAVGSLGLVGGQYQDLRGGQTIRGLSEAADTNGRKTGSLFLAAVQLGAIVADATPGQRRELAAFAGELGHAFQLLDDLLDASADPATIGKDTGQDEGKSTVVALVGVGRTQRLVARHMASARAHLSNVFGDVSRLHDLLDGLGMPLAEDPVEQPHALLEQEAGLR